MTLPERGSAKEKSLRNWTEDRRERNKIKHARNKQNRVRRANEYGSGKESDRKGK